MKKQIVQIAVVLLCLWGTMLPASGQITLVEDSRPVSRIVLQQDTETSRQAASLLQDFIKRISQATLPVTTGKSTRAGDVVIREDTSGRIGEDGFRIHTADQQLFISGGPGKGSIYGVVTLLEQYLGVSYYAANACTYSSLKTVQLPQIERTEVPAFRYRQTWSYGNEDPVYKLWFRLEEPNEMFIDNMWVHTFNRILPASVFGKEHPEYYSFINGERRPGDNSQWCLTNPEVFEVVASRLDSIFTAHPDIKMISISQNDGNNTNCRCPACREVDEYEGSPSGNFIRFLNKLAERFPDQEFSTLAYLFTMQPPKHVKTLKNVNIMLCDIDCKREVPLTDNESGQVFVKALEGWSRISDNIFVWD